MPVVVTKGHTYLTDLQLKAKAIEEEREIEGK